MKLKKFFTSVSPTEIQKSNIYAHHDSWASGVYLDLAHFTLDGDNQTDKINFMKDLFLDGWVLYKKTTTKTGNVKYTEIKDIAKL